MQEFRLETGDGRTVCAAVRPRRVPVPRGCAGCSAAARSTPDEGILLRPAGSIHTAFMRFPIDAVFLDGERAGPADRGALPPWRTAAAKGAKAVVELPAGAAAAARLTPGELLRLPG